MSQGLRRQLFEFLLALPELQQMSAVDWRTFFFRQVGLEDRIYVRINWNGSQQAVVNEVLEHIVAEGKPALLQFCQKFDNEHICGFDQRAIIRRLSSSIAQLSEREWEEEFALNRHANSLQAGEQALKRQDYSQALVLLKRAVSTIPTSQKRLAAKARYLQALALLGKDLPRHKPATILEKIEDLIKAASALENSSAFLLTLVAIKRDIYTAVPSSSQRAELDYWQRQTGQRSRTTYDQELLDLFKQCQPYLYSQL